LAARANPTPSTDAPSTDAGGGRCSSQVRHLLKVACDANRADKLAKIDRHELAARDGHHREILDLALVRRGSVATN
jgi:hypothetical protein